MRTGSGPIRLVRLASFAWRLPWATANRFGWLGQTPVGTSPHLDPDALASWRKAVANSDVYLEYGSGGSTVEAIESVAHVVSVETDIHYLTAVEAVVVATAATIGRFHPVHVDIGWTEKWGRPVFTYASDARLGRWRAYSLAPWTLLEELGLVPDFIFVDGRFRTASVLESFLQLPNGADCLFMLDDFDGRELIYESVLAFATDIEAIGRARVFRRDPKFDRDECSKLLEIHQTDPE